MPVFYCLVCPTWGNTVHSIRQLSGVTIRGNSTYPKTCYPKFEGVSCSSTLWVCYVRHRHRDSQRQTNGQAVQAVRRRRPRICKSRLEVARSGASNIDLLTKRHCCQWVFTLKSDSTKRGRVGKPGASWWQKASTPAKTARRPKPRGLNVTRTASK